MENYLTFVLKIGFDDVSDTGMPKDFLLYKILGWSQEIFEGFLGNDTRLKFLHKCLLGECLYVLTWRFF